ncbi:MAG: lipid-A-disaccharide synthase N-terminal domain-containing protein [Bacteroidales bacterium]
MEILIYTIGFLAQSLFFARFLIQWILSEKARKVLSPVIFWQLSMTASFLLFIYGWVRDDFAILLGQLLSYYIYIWNLKIQDNWRKMPSFIRILFFSFPMIATGWLLLDWQNSLDRLFFNEEIPVRVLLWGSAGQIIFTMRFIYQWLYSKKREESILPAGFWYISIGGAFIILSYAIFRHDPVLIIGQGTGLFVYIRNLFILRKTTQQSQI